LQQAHHQDRSFTHRRAANDDQFWTASGVNRDGQRVARVAEDDARDFLVALIGACPDETGLLSGRRWRTTEDGRTPLQTCLRRIDAARRSASRRPTAGVRLALTNRRSWPWTTARRSFDRSRQSGHAARMC
jgi:hypothetical protein